MATEAQTAQLKKRFLESFRRHGNVSWACRESGAERRTVYKWKEIDNDFLGHYQQAELDATERMEEAAYERAVNGVEQTRPIVSRGTVIAQITTTEYSDSLLMFMLKARAPEKYRERHEVKHNGQIEHVGLEYARGVLRIVGGTEHTA